MPARSAWNATHYRQRDSYFTNTGSGRLRLEIAGYGGREGRVYRWSDGARMALEDKLPAVLAEVEIRGAEDAHRQHVRQAQEEARRAQQEQAAQRAAAEALEKQRADELMDQLHRWETTHRLRRYLAALQNTIEQRQQGATIGEASLTNAVQWLIWGQDYTQQLDPLSDLTRMPRLH